MFTVEQYRVAQLAYVAYKKQLAASVLLPSFLDLPQSVKDAWASAANAVALDAEWVADRLPGQERGVSHAQS